MTRLSNMIRRNINLLPHQRRSHLRLRIQFKTNMFGNTPHTGRFPLKQPTTPTRLPTSAKASTKKSTTTQKPPPVVTMTLNPTIYPESQHCHQPHTTNSTME